MSLADYVAKAAEGSHLEVSDPVPPGVLVPPPGKYFKQDFSEVDWSSQDLRGREFHLCAFRRADLSYANAEGVNFYGSDFTGARLYHLNAKDAVMAKTIMAPRDALGMTVTLDCNTFDGMEFSRMGWALMGFLLSLAKAPEKKLQDAIRAALPEETKALEAVLRWRT